MSEHQVQTSPEMELEDDFVDELEQGTRLLHGQYMIEDFLAAGGFGITYLARDSLGRRVVIKECFPGTLCHRDGSAVQPRSRARAAEMQKVVRLFTQEAQSLARVEHPNIVRVHHVFAENNTAYMAMDFVDGRDLLDIVTSDDITLAPQEIELYLRRILDAIGYVHDTSLLHRDISPDNIIVRRDGEPVLIDFGAAREQASEADKALSALRVIKDGYSPQEFYIAGSEQNASSDLYSLAASFYHIITGELAANSQVRLAAIAAGDADPYVPLTERSVDFSRSFCAALDQAMAILPKDRVQSAKEWVATMDDPMAGKARKGKAATSIKSKPKSAQAGGNRTVAVLGGLTGLAAVAVGIAIMFPTKTPGDVTLEATSAVSTPVETVDEATLTQVAPVEPAREEVAVADVVETEAAAEETLASVEPAQEDTVLPAEDLDLAQQVAEPEETTAGDARHTINLPVRTSPFRTWPPLATLPRIASVDQPVPMAVSIGPEPAQTSPLQPRRVALVPFTIGDDLRVSAPEDQAADWMTEGLRLVSVDGAAVSDRADATALLARHVNRSEDAVVPIAFGFASSDGELMVRLLDVPVAERLSLPNQFVFDTSREGDGWVTHVSSAPADTTIKPGDRLVAHMGTSTLVNERSSLPSLLSSEIEAGATEFTFAIERDGEMWVETFTLPGAAL